MVRSLCVLFCIAPSKEPMNAAQSSYQIGAAWHWQEQSQHVQNATVFGPEYSTHVSHVVNASALCVTDAEAHALVRHGLAAMTRSRQGSRSWHIIFTIAAVAIAGAFQCRLVVSVTVCRALCVCMHARHAVCAHVYSSGRLTCLFGSH